MSGSVTAQAIPLVIVGAGPCGLAAGIAARRAGVRCVLFDKGSVVSSIAGYPTYMTFFSTAERLEIGGVPFVVTGDKPTRREALRYYQRLAREFELDVRQYERVEHIERAAPHDASGARFALHTHAMTRGARRYSAESVVVATGYFDWPNLLNVPGEQLPKVKHRYSEGHAYYDQDVVVVGGGNSAVDAALELHRWGARVTIVHFAPDLDPNIKPWVRPDIEARLREGAIAARFGARIAEIGTDSVTIRFDDGGSTEVLGNDWVLAMTGYMPDRTLLEQIGVEFDEVTGIPRHEPDTMQTNVPGVFIAGVLSAGFNANKVFIENGRDHGELIVGSLRGGARR